MRPTAPHLRLPAGLILLVLAALPAGRAEAGILLGTPVVVSGGDPWYRYTTPIFLDHGFSWSPAIGQGKVTKPVDPWIDDYLTIYNIRGLDQSFNLFSDPKGFEGSVNDYGSLLFDAPDGFTPLGQSRPPLRQPPYEPLGDVVIYMLKGEPPVVNDTGAPFLLGYLVLRAWLPEGVDPTLVFDYTWQARDLNGDRRSGAGSVNVIPEPASILLVGLGAGGLALRLRRRRRAS